MPDDAAVVEALDSETGATILRFGRPLELYRESGTKPAIDRFAFLGPFETNQMGQRATYLWIAVPESLGADAPLPTLEADGVAIDLGDVGRAPEFAHLQSSPYKAPTPWSEMYYFKLPRITLETLVKAGALSIRTSGPEGESTYGIRRSDDVRLTEFAARVASN